MKRYFYAFDTIEAARNAAAQLRNRGITDQNISIVIGHNIDSRRESFWAPWRDLIPKLGRGAAVGGIVGVCAGTAALWLIHLQAATGYFMLLMFATAGAILGAWISTPVESTVLLEGPRVLRDEIQAGRTLLIVDADAKSQLPAIRVLNDAADPHLLWQCMKHTPAIRESGLKVSPV